MISNKSEAENQSEVMSPDQTFAKEWELNSKRPCIFVPRAFSCNFSLEAERRVWQTADRNGASKYVSAF
jgi:hypothetical protein